MVLNLSQAQYGHLEPPRGGPTPSFSHTPTPTTDRHSCTKVRFALAPEVELVAPGMLRMGGGLQQPDP